MDPASVNPKAVVTPKDGADSTSAGHFCSHCKKAHREGAHTREGNEKLKALKDARVAAATGTEATTTSKKGQTKGKKSTEPVKKPKATPQGTCFVCKKAHGPPSAGHPTFTVPL